MNFDKQPDIYFKTTIEIRKLSDTLVFLMTNINEGFVITLDKLRFYILRIYDKKINFNFLTTEENKSINYKELKNQTSAYLFEYQL